MLSVDKSFELQPGQCFPQDDFNEFEEEREEKPLFQMCWVHHNNFFLVVIADSNRRLESLNQTRLMRVLLSYYVIIFWGNDLWQTAWRILVRVQGLIGNYRFRQPSLSIKVSCFWVLPILWNSSGSDWDVSCRDGFLQRFYSKSIQKRLTYFNINPLLFLFPKCLTWTFLWLHDWNWFHPSRVSFLFSWFSSIRILFNFLLWLFNILSLFGSFFFIIFSLFVPIFHLGL